MDANEVLQLIQICPSPKADAFRLWIAVLAEEGANIVKSLVEAIIKVKDTVRCKVADILITVHRKEFNLFDKHEESLPIIRSAEGLTGYYLRV